MITQEIFDAIIGLAGLLGGWWIKIIWDALKQLQESDRKLAEKVSRVEVLVAGNYVRKEEFERVIERLMNKLDHIMMKIDKKADKESV